MQGERLTLTAVGDCQISTRHSTCTDASFLQLVKLLREADVGYANLEHLIHDYGPEAYPVYKTGGTFTRAPPYVVDEFKWMGVDMMSSATNHAFDYMAGGIKETVANLTRGGIAHSGIGVNLAAARAPGFVDTAQGRVALLSVATGSDITWSATDARKDMKGTPGINLIRVSRIYTLDPTTFETLRGLVNKLQPFGLLGGRGKVAADAEEITVTMGEGLRGVLSTQFVLGDEVSIKTVAHEEDVEGNLQIVRDARRQADWVFVACHHHVWDDLNREVPASYLQDFAKACIDEGADGLLGNGPHQIQGIEIYKGKPIFYSLPDFIQQRDLVAKDPQIFYETFGLGFENTPMDAMDERARTTFKHLYDVPTHAQSSVAVSTFRGDTVEAIKLYPADLGFRKPRHQFGRPKAANPDVAEQIVTRWTRLSAPFGTKITFEDGIGVVHL
jgi:poly-gamma-glutamate synthesis protein (capsule biosynthesis protein)